jgi:hypothetical protein
VTSLFALNEHPIERAARVLVGLGLIWAAYTGALGAWAYLGLVPVLTGATGRCPLYSVLGISTCPARTRTTR